MTDPDQLSELLHRWTPSPGADPAFAHGVHARLAAAPGLLARILQFPATLPLAAGFAMVIGAVAAVSLNRAQAVDQMADAYAHRIDPEWLSFHLDH